MNETITTSEEKRMKMIKFNKYNVTDTESKLKARVHYNHHNLVSTGEECVTIYAKDYTNDLHKIFSEGYENDTDTMTDYFEKGRVRILKGSEYFEAALARFNANQAAIAAKRG